MFKLTLLFLWPRFYAQTSSLSSPFVKYLYKYVLRFCSLVTMLPRRRRTGRKAGGVSCFRFQNERNKVEIALRVVQFCPENQTCDYKSHSRFAVVRFCNHAFDCRPNCTPLSAITIINLWLFSHNCKYNSSHNVITNIC